MNLKEIMNLSEFGDFKAHLKFERGLLKQTVDAYLYCMDKVVDFLGRDPRDANRDDIRNFLESLQERGLRKSSISCYIVAMRAFYNWLADKTNDQRIITLSFFLSKILKTSRECRITVVPTTEEIKKLRATLTAHKLAASFNKESYLYKTVLRDIAIIELLITTGIRSIELRHLTLSDIDIEGMTICVRFGKGGKQRVALFNESAQVALKEFLANTRFYETDYVFERSRGNTVNYIIQRWAKRANINHKIHAHSFRHYFITESQRQGVDTQAVADQVGHKNLNTTRRYTHYNVQTLKDKFKLTNI